MMPTKDSDSSIPYFLIGSQGGTPNQDSLNQNSRVLPPLNKPTSLQTDSDLQLYSRSTSHLQTLNNNSSPSATNRQRLNMDHRTMAGYSSSGDSSNNSNNINPDFSSMTGEARTGSGRIGDPIEIHHTSQECSFNSGIYEEDDEGLSVIPPSPERHHGHLLGSKGSVSKDTPGTEETNTYASPMEGIERQVKSPSWQAPGRQSHVIQREIPRRITFSQESLQHTPTETRESLSVYAQNQMSPEKALKRTHYISASSNSDEAEAKKRKADLHGYQFDPYKFSYMNSGRTLESQSSKNSFATQSPVSSFRDHLKLSGAAPPMGSHLSDQSCLSSPPPFTSRDHCPIGDSDQILSSTDSWNLQLSETQHSQPQSPVVADQQAVSPVENVTPQLAPPSYQNRIPIEDDEFERHYKSSSHMGQGKHRQVERIQQVLHTKKASTPLQDSGSEENPSSPSKPYKKLPPLVLHLSHASTITPTSTANTSTPSSRPSSQMSQEHSSSLVHEDDHQDKVLVNSTETSAIFHQMSSDSSLYDTGHNVPKNTPSDVPLKAGLRGNPTEVSTPQQQLDALDTHSSKPGSTVTSTQQASDMHLEGNPHKTHQAAATIPLEEPDKDAKRKGNLLFSPEVISGSGANLKQKKRPHSDEEFARNVRPTRDFSSQTDISHDDSKVVSFQEKETILTPPEKSISDSDVSVICRIRDVFYRYREFLSADGKILRYEPMAFEERTFPNVREEDLPPLMGQSQDSNRNWSSLSSGELGDVSSSIPSSKSASNSSLQSLSLPNSMSQLPIRRPASKGSGNKSTSLHAMVDRHSSNTPQSSSTSSAFSAGTVGASQDNDYLFAKPMDPGWGSSLPEKAAPRSAEEVVLDEAQEQSSVVNPIMTTPVKRSPTRSHKKGANKRSPMSKRRSPKSKKTSSSSSNTSSPEVPPPLVKESPVKEESFVLPGQFHSGLKVMARWTDSYFYSGTLSEIDPSGKWEVNFEDGSQRCVRESDILDEALVVKGQSVLALSPDGYYDPGILQARYSEDNQQGFVVDLDNGKSLRFKRGSVILSSDQAAVLLRRRSLDQPVASLSLDNIVEGKRRRTPKSFADNGTPAVAPRPMATRALGVLPQPPPLLSSRRRYKPDPNIQSSDYNTTSEDVSDRPSLIPRLKLQRSKKDPDRYQCSDMETEEVSFSPRKASVSRSSAGTDDERGSKKSTPTKSPKKSSPVKNACSDVQFGPFSQNNDIFHGLYFLISCAERSAKQRQRKQTDSLNSDVDQDDSIEMLPHLDRDHVSLQIQRAGGIVLESFEETESVPKKQVILISNTHLRTLKFIKCVAAGIPCISVDWVNNCCVKNKRLKYDEYALPAGYSIVDREVVNCFDRHKKSNSILCDMRVMLWSEKNPDFVSFWTPVLLAAQASVVVRPVESKLSVGNFGMVDVVVSDPSLPPHILRRFRELNIPIVSSEWVIQCIITGKRQAFNAHSKFEHTYVDD